MSHHGNGGPKDCAEQPDEDYSEHERIGELFHHHVSGGENDNRCNQADEERILRSHEDDEAVFRTRRGLGCVRSGHEQDHIEGERATQSLGASASGEWAGQWAERTRDEFFYFLFSESTCRPGRNIEDPPASAGRLSLLS